ncbi:MAG: hypothetical protein WD850_02095 [Candidatus Spechtbacterales bacterium]
MRMLIIVHGNNDFQARMTLRALVAEYRQRLGERVPVARFFDDASPRELREALGGVSLFAEARLVVLERLSQNKALCEETLAASATLQVAGRKDVIALFFEQASVAGSKMFAPLLKRADKVYECKEATPAQKAMRLAELQPALSAAIVREVLRRCGADMWRSHQELSKLALYARGRTATLADLDTLSIGSEEAKIFPTLDALFAGNADTAFKQLQLHWQHGEQPLGVFALIERQLKLLALVKEQHEAGVTASAAIAQKTGIAPFVAGKTSRMAARYSMPKIKELYQRVESLDRKTKTGAMNPYLACELLASAVVA